MPLMNAFKCQELLVTLGVKISIMMVLTSSLYKHKNVMYNALLNVQCLAICYGGLYITPFTDAVVK